MKQPLLIILLLFLSVAAFGQRDSIMVSGRISKGYFSEDNDAGLTIYPVPVRENSFTISSGKEISAVKITNIIGQDIFMAKYNIPVLTTKIVLENSKRGMYLVVITFSDNTRSVKRILVEGSI